MKIIYFFLLLFCLECLALPRCEKKTHDRAPKGQTSDEIKLQEIRLKVEALIPIYKAEMTRNHMSWARANCRGASGIFRRLLREHYGIEAQAVSNSCHTYLILPNFFEDTSFLVIDPSIQQYAPAAPIVFVGSEDDFREMASRIPVNFPSYLYFFFFIDSGVPEYK